MNTGPTVKYVCDGCKYLFAKQINLWGESWVERECRHPEKTPIGLQNEYTPEWCPELPK